MKHGTKTILSKKIGVSSAYIGMIVNGKRLPSWRTAKKLAKATGTDPVMWMEGTPEEKYSAISEKSFSCEHHNKKSEEGNPV